MKRWQLLKLADDNLLNENDIIICKYGVTHMLKKEIRYINKRFVNNSGRIENIVDLYNCTFEIYRQEENKGEELIKFIEQFNNEELTEFQKSFIRESMKNRKQAIIIFQD